MSDRAKNFIAIGVSLVAVAFIVFAFSAAPAPEPTAEDRIESLSSAIRCPFCNGESLADSQAGVAADYRALIAERIEAGATDEEIMDEFAANFGDSFILDTSTSAWSIALWLVPVLALLAGGAAVFVIKRGASERETVDG
jgi:cytochrome c-type biogenesis protein CcmH